jgi:hypothetical protein
MKLTLPRVLVIVAIILAAVVFLVYVRDATSPGAAPTTAAPGPDSQTQCPVATPEYFLVEPVTSPTDQLSQTITVDLGNGETITVTAESGTFAAPFDNFPKEIEISLLPDTTHNLMVEGRVREVVQGNCTYGGYTLSTTTDRNGDPLIIVQQP